MVFQQRNHLFNPTSNCSQSQSKQWWAPFSPPVWLSIGLSSISMAVLMFLLISKIEINILPNPPPKAMGPLQIVWFIFGALVKQGSPLPPKSDVARILCGTWWIFITVVRLF